MILASRFPEWQIYQIYRNFERPFVRKELVTSAMLPPISLDTQIGVRVRERLW